MEKISHIYNENIVADEFDKLCISKIDDLALIDENFYCHNVLIFLNSPQFNYYRGHDLYTILGYDDKNKKFSFAFGKNEWFHDNYETSYTCAKRELFEEFHILYTGKYA